MLVSCLAPLSNTQFRLGRYEAGEIHCRRETVLETHTMACCCLPLPHVQISQARVSAYSV